MAYYRLFVLFTSCLAIFVCADDELASLPDDIDQSQEPNYDEMQSLLTNMYLNDLLEGNEDVAEQYSMSLIYAFTLTSFLITLDFLFVLYVILCALFIVLTKKKSFV